MLNQKRVLIAEDELFIALDLTWTVQDAGGRVVGPVARVAEALEAVEQGEIDAAILDVNLKDGDSTPVAEALARRRVPVVMHTGSEIPDRLRAQCPTLPVVGKPAEPLLLTRQLAQLLLRSDQQTRVA